MRKGIIVDVSAADRVRSEAVVADGNSPQKHVWRARIVLLTASARAPDVRFAPTGARLERKVGAAFSMRDTILESDSLGGGARQL